MLTTLVCRVVEDRALDDPGLQSLNHFHMIMDSRDDSDLGLAIRLALPLVDVLIGNDLELKLVAGVEDLDRAVRVLRPRVPILVSKLGAEGTRVWTDDGPVFMPPYRVEVLSTIGAGDGFSSRSRAQRPRAAKSYLMSTWAPSREKERYYL